MQICLLVIGDEILSGKRQDKHVPHVIAQLKTRGLELHRVEFLPDNIQQIAQAISRAHAAGELLLSCGGIGATPDDCTRQAAGLAFNLPLQAHPEGTQLLQARYGAATYPNRIILVQFPQGAGLIPNPINQVPGFYYQHSHFVPGFPEMAWPMLEWVLDTRYAHLHHQQPQQEYRLRMIGNAGEGDLLTLMQETIAAHQGLKLSSLPFRGSSEQVPHIEFGFKAAPAVAASAYQQFMAALQARGQQVIALDAPKIFSD